MRNETTMTADRPEILTALEGVAKRAGSNLESPARLLDIPLIERDNNGFCTVSINETEDVGFSDGCFIGDLTKIRCDEFKVIYWADHPAECMFEEAIEDGEIDEDTEEIPDNMWEEGETILQDLIEEELFDRLGLDVTINMPSELYSPYGGYVVYVRTKDRYSIDLTRAIARVIGA